MMVALWSAFIATDTIYRDAIHVAEHYNYYAWLLNEGEYSIERLDDLLCIMCELTVATVYHTSTLIV